MKFGCSTQLLSVGLEPSRGAVDNIILRMRLHLLGSVGNGEACLGMLLETENVFTVAGLGTSKETAGATLTYVWCAGRTNTA